jgi:CheY-like chemotaxis protein
LRLANEASEAKSGFLAAMSHELRTPLNAVIGFANLLQDNLEPSVRESHLHGLQVAAHQLMSVIDDVLDFSRVEARALKLEEISFSLIDCVASTLQMVAGSAESKGLCLTMVEHGAAGMRFVGDPARVRQIALNLLSNAVKFTHDGAVSLSLGIFRDGACADVVIAVADSGIGMSQETLEKLFTPFRQGDTSTVRQYGGSGLGLSICRSLVELMGGRIDVDSALGQGSRFLVRLRLPVAAGPDLPSGRLLAGHRIGFTVRSPHLESTLRNQLREYGATPVFVPPTQFTEETLKEAGSFSALVVGHAMLQRAADFESWPLASEGTSPLPVIPLVGMDASQAERLGPHGERIIPVSRALTPSQLLGAIQSCISGSSVARYARNEDFDQLMFEGLQVLVVEDNEINQTILSMQLESLGIVPVLASGGQEAIELLVQHRCDIILMDVEMPGMDGLQATTSILDSVADDQLAPYVIAVTAHVFGDTRERMRSAGMVDFVAKPVVMDDLRAALARGKAAVTRGVQQPGRQAESQPRIPMQS